MSQLIGKHTEDEFTFTNSQLTKYPAVGTTFEWKEEYETCSICFESLDCQDTQIVSFTTCAEPHYFHHGCIQLWIERYTYCPICKNAVDKTQIYRFWKSISDIKTYHPNTIWRKSVARRGLNMHAAFPGDCLKLGTKVRKI